MIFAVCGIFFALFGAIFVIVVLYNSDRVVEGVLVFGGFWGAWLALCLVQYHRRWMVDGEGITRLRPFRRRILWSDVEQILVQKDEAVGTYHLTFVPSRGRMLQISSATTDDPGITPYEAIVSRIPESLRADGLSVKDVDIMAGVDIEFFRFLCGIHLGSIVTSILFFPFRKRRKGG